MKEKKRGNIRSVERWSKIILGLVFLALCLWGCEKRVKLSQCEGDTPEEKVEDFLEQKYGEDFVVTEVDSTTTGPFGGYRHAKAYLADDPTQCTFRIWREDGGYDARFLLDMRDEVQEDINSRVSEYLDDYYLYTYSTFSYLGDPDFKYKEGKTTVQDLYQARYYSLSIFICVPEETDQDTVMEMTEHIWENIDNYDMRFRVFYIDSETLIELQEGKLDFKWNDMYADGTIDSCFYGQENEFEKIYYDNFEREYK